MRVTRFLIFVRNVRMFPNARALLTLYLKWFSEYDQLKADLNERASISPNP